MKRKQINSNDFGSQYVREISDIASQYFKKEMGLNFFGHITAYNNGNFSFLYTEDNLANKIIAEQKTQPTAFCHSDHIIDQVIFPELEQRKTLDWLGKIVTGAKNPMMIMKKYDGHHEIFIFDLDRKNAYETYMNHFNLSIVSTFLFSKAVPSILALLYS